MRVNASFGLDGRQLCFDPTTVYRIIHGLVEVDSFLLWFSQTRSWGRLYEILRSVHASLETRNHSCRLRSSLLHVVLNLWFRSLHLQDYLLFLFDLHRIFTASSWLFFCLINITIFPIVPPYNLLIFFIVPNVLSATFFALSSYPLYYFFCSVFSTGTSNLSKDLSNLSK